MRMILLFRSLNKDLIVRACARYVDGRVTMLFGQFGRRFYPLSRVELFSRWGGAATFLVEAAAGARQFLAQAFFDAVKFLDRAAGPFVKSVHHRACLNKEAEVFC